MMDIYNEFLKYAHLVDMRANQLTSDMIRELDQAHGIITGKLATLEAETLSNPFMESPHSSKKKLLAFQKQAVEAVARDIFTEIEKLSTEAAEDTIAASAVKTHAVLTETIPGLNIAFNKMHLPTVKKWFEVTTVDGLLVNELLAKLEQSAIEKITAAGRQALIQGKDVQSLARMIKKQGIEGTYRGIEGFSRTLLMSASNYAKEQTVESNFSDVIRGWMHTATLDGRTCPVCASLDTKKFKLNEGREPLPLHFNCRCLYVPYTEDGQKMGRRPTVKHTERWVNHRDGTRSREFTPDRAATSFKGSYQEWLQQQLKEDPAFVEKVLGKKRFELFSQGKITLTQMVTEGRVKRLSEL